MRATAILALVLLVPVSVMAVSTSRTPGPKTEGIPVPSPPLERQGGETMLDAFPIPTLPFSDTGSTTGHVDNYDWCCPYTGSIAPDVVYSYVATGWTYITVDLCSSLYDTKVYVVEDAWPNVIACNDDASCGYSGYQSRLDNVLTDAGHTYYIIVDGYHQSWGTYNMEVYPTECFIPCPPGAYTEQEPWCYDNYVDESNSGCSHDPVLFEDLAPSPPGEALTVCGTSGTYLFGSLQYRDTDWYQLTLTETRTITVRGKGYFPILIFLIYNADCANPLFDYSIAPYCVTAEVTREVGPGNVWVWVGPSVFSDIPCGTEYVLTILGYEATTPVEGVRWGTIKAMYR